MLNLLRPLLLLLSVAVLTPVVWAGEEPVAKKKLTVMLDWFENSSNNRLSTFASEVGFDLPWALLSPQVAVGEDWSVVPNAVEFGVAMNDLSLKRAIGVWALNDSISDEGLAYLGGDDTVVRTSWSVANYVHESFRLTPTQGRLLLLGFSLLLVMLLISIGMALWAVESRDERDVLVAIGNPTFGNVRGRAPAAVGTIIASRSILIILLTLLTTGIRPKAWSDDDDDATKRDDDDDGDGGDDAGDGTKKKTKKANTADCIDTEASTSTIQQQQQQQLSLIHI